MMDTIRYMQRSNIDVVRWNDCISHAVNGNIYAYSWYLDVVSPGWSALVLGDYDTIFPLTSRKKYGISYLAQPFFTQQLGIFSTRLLTEETTQIFLDKIPSRYRLIEINLNAYNKLGGIKFEISQFTNLELDLIPDYDSIYKGYSENLRRNLKKAKAGNLNILPLNSFKELIDIFRTHKGKDLNTFKERDYQTLLHLIHEGEQHKAVQSAGAYLPDGSLCAGAIFAFANKKAVFLFSAANAKAREFSAIPFLIDDFIRQHCGTPLTLDFEGSNDPDLARFYRSFGAINCSYPHIRKNSLPRYVNFIMDHVK